MRSAQVSRKYILCLGRLHVQTCMPLFTERLKIYSEYIKTKLGNFLLFIHGIKQLHALLP